MIAPIELHWVQRQGSIPGGLMRPSTIEEAAQALAENPQLRPVAGGSDLLLELARDEHGGRVDLLDMTGIHEFGTLFFDDDLAIIGAGVTHAEIVGSADARDKLLPLAQACLEIGSPQLRNRATIVGNLVTASPANDTISALMALNASVHVVRYDGAELVNRTVALHDFYDGFRSTVLAPDELVSMLTVPHTSAGRRGIWVKTGLRKAQAISVVHAGLVLEFAPDASILAARIALGSVGPTVALSEPASQALVGSALTPEAIARAADAAVDSVSPIDDGRASAAYRRDSVRTVVARALRALAAGQERGRWPVRVPLLSGRTEASRADRHSASTPPPARTSLGAESEVSVMVNGTQISASPMGSGTLLDWLRETTGTGTKEGCAEGECGACTVVVDGDAVMSCLVPATQADGATVTSVEGMGSAELPSLMQQAFVDKFAVQCGYCIPGFIVAAQTLADELGETPSREEIELALSGNLCRCTGYYNIIEAVQAAIVGSTGDAA